MLEVEKLCKSFDFDTQSYEVYKKKLYMQYCNGNYCFEQGNDGSKWHVICVFVSLIIW
jgi:hypothetical protein